MNRWFTWGVYKGKNNTTLSSVCLLNYPNIHSHMLEPHVQIFSGGFALMQNFHWFICNALTVLNHDISLCLSSVTAPSSPLSPPVSPSLSFPETPLISKSGECTVCFDQEVDTVIYTCGHMCLCHECGLKLKKQINACCPICRRPIKDVIKTYRP